MRRFLMHRAVGGGAAGFIEANDEDFSSLYGMTRDLSGDLKSNPCQEE